MPRWSVALSSKLFTDWLGPVPSTATDVPLFKERANARAAGLKELKDLLVAHFVGEETVLKMGGYAKAANTIRNSLPTTKRTQSGDLGELIATEYVDAQTPFSVPIRKLRWKSDRKMPMHGNDVVAVEKRSGRRVRVLKGESKSAATVSAATVSVFTRPVEMPRVRSSRTSKPTARSRRGTSST